MRLYLKYLGIHLRSTMQHKASFAILTLGQFITSFSAFLVVYFIFDRFGELDGFSFNEVLICFSVVLMSFSIAECMARGFDMFPSMISNGQFDRILVRPRNEIFQVLASTVEFSRLGRMLQAILVLAWAIPHSGIIWTGDRVFTLVLMIMGGTALFSALFWIYASLSFFTLEGLEFMNVFTDGGRDHGAYPMSVYGKEVLAFYTYIVPLACVQYYPLMYLVGRWDNPWLMLCPLAGVAFMLPAYILWRVGVRHYRSIGS